MNDDLETAPVGTIFTRGEDVLYLDQNFRATPITMAYVRSMETGDLGRVEATIMQGLLIVSWDGAESESTVHYTQVVLAD